MAGQRRLRILGGLVRDGATPLETRRLCEVGAGVTGMTGAGIMLMSDEVPRGSVCSSNAVSQLIEDLQFTLGEGPCIDAYHHDRPVLEPALAEPVQPRWHAFAGPALDAGARAVFGFPMRVGVVRLGALNLYRDRPGELTDDQHADALVMAEVAAETVLLVQAEAPPDQIATELEVGADFHYVVHQAAGMVAAQLDVSVGQALVRLRAHAFGSGLPLRQVAENVVARTMRFEADPRGNDD